MRKLGDHREEVEKEVMKYIRYCERKNILNSCCNLSTIEYLRLIEASEVRKALKDLKRIHGR